MGFFSKKKSSSNTYALKSKINLQQKASFKIELARQQQKALFFSANIHLFDQLIT